MGGVSKKRSAYISFTLLLLCYLLWGLQPLYWPLLEGFDSMFIMCVRVCFAMLFTWLYLLLTGQFGVLMNTFKDKHIMKALIPAAVFLSADWALFIWAVTHGHVLDTSLGYYFNPLVIFLIGVILFKEKSHALEYIAILVACVGIVITSARNSEFILISLCFALIWPVYASIKKKCHAPAVVSFAVEVSLMLPFALVGMLLFYRGDTGLAHITARNLPLLVGSGIVTALPMILYNMVVNAMPFKVLGVTQYLSSTINVLCGVLFMNEVFTRDKAIMFGFIWLGLILFTVGNFRKHDTV